MKKLIVILTILWFVGWGYWFLYERGHVITTKQNVNQATLNQSTTAKEAPLTNNDTKDKSSNDEEVGTLKITKNQSFEEQIISSIDSLKSGQLIQLISYYDENEEYQGKYENKGIERSIKRLSKIEDKYIDSLIFAVGLKAIEEDSINVDSFYQIKIFNKEQPLQEINPKRFFIFFPYASDNEVAASKIEEIIDSLSNVWQGQSFDYLILGHTDDQATESTNYLLGVNRAKSLQQKLANAGIPKDNIKILSKGENEPITTNLKAEGRYLNRRAEIILRSK
ncbi:OmpA family protein [Membranihabitans marinus]|uniref:OmpA family protein n=1 Tax=Membranihabitans marinus TaxID=1227546 RepID=UPI001F3303C5|nr:OmpA family protein [Membranihabitans marinus]